jgi:hypothetical protein
MKHIAVMRLTSREAKGISQKGGLFILPAIVGYSCRVNEVADAAAASATALRRDFAIISSVSENLECVRRFEQSLKSIWDHSCGGICEEMVETQDEGGLKCKRAILLIVYPRTAHG